jgi:hypothetical protein
MNNCEEVEGTKRNNVHFGLELKLSTDWELKIWEIKWSWNLLWIFSGIKPFGKFPRNSSKFYHDNTSKILKFLYMLHFCTARAEWIQNWVWTLNLHRCSYSDTRGVTFSLLDRWSTKPMAVVVAMVEFCYNSGFQSSFDASPFNIVYAVTPPPPPHTHCTHTLMVKHDCCLCMSSW